MKKTIENCDNLSAIQGMVTDIIIENGKVVGIKTREGVEYRAKFVIIATGTFLRGLIILEINISVVEEWESFLQMIYHYH